MDVTLTSTFSAITAEHKNIINHCENVSIVCCHIYTCSRKVKSLSSQVFAFNLENAGSTHKNYTLRLLI